jgi:hypothetical protein
MKHPSITEMLATIRAADPVRADELDREAFAIVGINPEQPDAYDRNGEPLWCVTAEEMAERHNLPVEAVQALLEDTEREGGHIEPDPTVTVVRRDRLPPLGGRYTGEFDADGEEAVLLEVETAAVVVLERIWGDATGTEPYPPATRWLNAWLALARQRGASDMTLRRLRETIKAPAFDTGRVRLAARRVAKHASLLELLEIVRTPL